MPYRPMIRDRRTGGLIQAWPQLEKELLEVINSTMYILKAGILVRRYRPIPRLTQDACFHNSVLWRCKPRADVFIPGCDQY